MAHIRGYLRASSKMQQARKTHDQVRHNPFRLQISRVLIPHEYLSKSAQLSLNESCRLADSLRYYHTTLNRLLQQHRPKTLLMDKVVTDKFPILANVTLRIAAIPHCAQVHQ